MTVRLLTLRFDDAAKANLMRQLISFAQQDARDRVFRQRR
jgi:hypothetical protein